VHGYRRCGLTRVPCAPRVAVRAQLAGGEQSTGLASRRAGSADGPYDAVRALCAAMLTARGRAR
jgi:hypothetical protein